MSLYESVFIVRPDVPSQTVTNVAKGLISKIEELGGVILKKEYWGLRNLAYEIQKSNRGHYVMFKMDCSSEAVKKLEESYKLNESILRYMTLKVEKVDNEPSVMMKAPSEVQMH